MSSEERLLCGGNIGEALKREAGPTESFTMAIEEIDTPTFFCSFSCFNSCTDLIFKELILSFATVEKHNFKIHVAVYITSKHVHKVIENIIHVCSVIEKICKFKVLAPNYYLHTSIFNNSMNISVRNEQSCQYTLYCIGCVIEQHTLIACSLIVWHSCIRSLVESPLGLNLKCLKGQCCFWHPLGRVSQ